MIEKTYGQIIHRASDDSYVITKNGMPYHVYPYAAEFAQEWDEVFAYAETHPEMVTEEQPYVPPVPTLEEVKAAKLSEINAAADRAIGTLTATYPDREISTFDKQESGFIIGQRQALEDRLDACTTLEEVQGITVDISMPGGGEA